MNKPANTPEQLLATAGSHKDHPWGDAPIRTSSYTALVVGASDRSTKKELVPLSRSLAALASLVFPGLGLVLLFPDYASACSSVLVGVPAKQVVDWALSDPDAVVFSGEVVKVEYPQFHPQGVDSGETEKDESISTSKVTATIRVYEVWKGPEQGTLKVYTNHPAFCGYHFKEGQEYLVFASEWKRALKVDGGVVGTKPLSKSGADLALLGDGEKPMNSDALNDTSGVVPARAVVGLAGLAMAASFLLVGRLVRTG